MTATKPNAIPPKQQPVVFIALMALYTLLVFSWTLFIYPMGADYPVMAGLYSLSGPLEFFLQGEMGVFKSWTPGYHLVNLVLLYALMVTLFFYTRIIIQGPWWLGSLTAVLLMGNPLKSEAVLGLTGSIDLLAALTGLLTLTVYAAHTRRPSLPKYLSALALFFLAVTCFTSNRLLFLVLLLQEGIILPRGERCWRRLIPFFLLALVDPWIMVAFLEWPAYDPIALWTPLFLIPYPIGLYPETIARLYASPWMFYLAAACLCCALVVIGRRLNRSAFAFGLLGAVALRIYSWESPIDLTHQIGGGEMILPIALVNIAFASLCLGIMQHPKWRRPVVLGTTFLCLLFFVLQAQMNLAWRQAGGEVAAFQAAAEKASPAEGVLGILPDFRYVDGAPMCLSDAIAHRTPFSKLLPATPLLPLNLFSQEKVRISVIEQHWDMARLRIQGLPLARLLPDSSVGLDRYASCSTKDSLIHFFQCDADTVEAQLISKTGALPVQLLPWRLESAEE